MIKKITKLKNFGVFEDYTWPSGLVKFVKYNLIFGWNRGGKTTISRILESIEKKSIFDVNEFPQYPEGGEFEVATDDTGKTKIKNNNVDTSTMQVRVFNQDFVKNNIFFDDGSSLPIAYLSETEVKDTATLKALVDERAGLDKDYKSATHARVQVEKTLETFMTGLGREVSNILFDKAYNRTKVDTKIKSIGLDNFKDKILSISDLRKYEQISKSSAMDDVQHARKLIISVKDGDTDLETLDEVYKKAVSMAKKVVISETLDRLKSDEDLNNWVQQGYQLQKDDGKDEVCPYCEKPLDEGFLDSLAKHFSKDYSDLQTSLTNFGNNLKTVKTVQVTNASDKLYPDLRNTYSKKITEINTLANDINLWIDDALELLREKYKDPFSEAEGLKKPSDYISSYNTIVDEVNGIIDEHNKKSRNHAKEVVAARGKLELHTIGKALKAQDYKGMKTALTNARETEVTAKKLFDDNEGRILELEKKTSDIGKALIKINAHLESFFGRKEITLEPSDDKRGYIIKRGDKVARNLSEGEKTAITFAYFIVKTGEKDFDLKNGIVFIDDPISSLDSNFVYHCFSLIKNSFREVGQLFISTHNFQLFNLSKEWLIGKNTKARSAGNPEPCGFYMVESYLESDKRRARLVELDKTLKKFKSEYHFLFHELLEFTNTSTPEYTDYYTVGNMSRRLFDIFVDFKVPSAGDQKSKMDSLIKAINESDEKITRVDAEKVYKMVNAYSHNYDPTSTIEHKDMSELKESVSILLNIIKEADTNHYRVMERECI